jgi:hypothetical protein
MSPVTPKKPREFLMPTEEELQKHIECIDATNDYVGSLLVCAVLSVVFLFLSTGYTPLGLKVIFTSVIGFFGVVATLNYRKASRIQGEINSIREKQKRKMRAEQELNN